MKEEKTIYINGKPVIGSETSPYIIAEIGTNHNGDIEIARAMIKDIADSGCDCVKFQIYEGEEIVSKKIKSSEYGLDDIYGDIYAREMFDKYLKTPKKWFPELIQLAHSLNLHCAVTLHGENGIQWSLDYNFDLIKIASMDHTNLPLLESMVKNVKQPILISTGMAKLKDVDDAMEILKKHTPGVGIFYCVAIYPPVKGEISLENISYIANRYNCPVGFSDHTPSNTAASAALVYGSSIFEKHVTKDRTFPGPDHPFALEPRQLSEYVQSINETKSFIGPSNFGELSFREKENSKKYLKSIIMKKAMLAGEAISSEDIYLSRPGTGIKPKYYDFVVGKILLKDIDKESFLTWEDVEGGGN